MNRQKNISALPWYWAALSRLCLLLGQSRWLFIAQSLASLMLLRQSKRAQIVARNIQLCFPDMLPIAQRQRAHHALSTQWYALLQWLAISHPSQSYAWSVTVHGQHHWTAACQSSQGILVICPHSAFLEMAACAIYQRCQQQQRRCGYIYRNNGDDHDLTTRLRRYHMPHAQAIRADQTRKMKQFLVSGGVLMTFPDHDMGPERSVWVDFMGVPAATCPAFMKLAHISGAQCLPAYFLNQHPQPTLFLEAPIVLEKDPVKAAKWLNLWLAKIIKIAPAQYFWVHRRFKSQPQGTPCPYQQPAAFDARRVCQKANM